MERMDRDMPFLLQYEHVAWFEKGKVRILDRRVYPTEVRFVVCTDYHEVVQAIADMVTQSAGPIPPWAWAWPWLPGRSGTRAHGSRRSSCGRRPMTWHTPGLPRQPVRPDHLPLCRCGEGDPGCGPGSGGGHRGIHRGVPEPPVQHHAGGGDYLANLIPNGGAILTQCFGETIIGTVIRAARRQNKTFRAYCAETRPYLQGARLTSSCFAQMGIDTTVLTDNMIAYAMEREASTSLPQRRTPSPGTAISPTRSALSRSPSWPSISGCPTMSPASGPESGRRTTSSSRCGTPPKSSLIGGSPTRSPG